MLVLESDLNQAIALVDSKPANSGSFAIHFTTNITLDAALRTIDLLSGTTLTIDGATNALDGAHAFRGFFVSAGTVAFENLTVQATKAIGAAGTGGGGGGAGLGGGLFVGAGGDVSLDAVMFQANAAVGGIGGDGGPQGRRRERIDRGRRRTRCQWRCRCRWIRRERRLCSSAGGGRSSGRFGQAGVSGRHGPLRLSGLCRRPWHPGRRGSVWRRWRRRRRGRPRRGRRRRWPRWYRRPWRCRWRWHLLRLLQLQHHGRQGRRWRSWRLRRQLVPWQPRGAGLCEPARQRRKRRERRRGRQGRRRFRLHGRCRWRWRGWWQPRSAVRAARRRWRPGHGWG